MIQGSYVFLLGGGKPPFSKALPHGDQRPLSTFWKVSLEGQKQGFSSISRTSLSTRDLLALYRYRDECNFYNKFMEIARPLPLSPPRIASGKGSPGDRIRPLPPIHGLLPKS